MNILKKLRKPYLSIIIASVFLFISSDSSEVIQEPDLQTQEEFKTTSIENPKLANDLNDLFNSKKCQQK